MVYFGFFITQMISFSHFMEIIHNIIEDEIYGVGLGQKNGTMANQRNQLQLFHNIIFGFSLENL